MKLRLRSGPRLRLQLRQRQAEGRGRAARSLIHLASDWPWRPGHDSCAAPWPGPGCRAAAPGGRTPTAQPAEGGRGADSAERREEGGRVRGGMVGGRAACVPMRRGFGRVEGRVEGAGSRGVRKRRRREECVWCGVVWWCTLPCTSNVKCVRTQAYAHARRVHVRVCSGACMYA